MPQKNSGQVIASALFAVTLATVGWGFQQGWFSPQPLKPVVVEDSGPVLILDTSGEGKPANGPTAVQRTAGRTREKKAATAPESAAPERQWLRSGTDQPTELRKIWTGSPEEAAGARTGSAGEIGFAGRSDSDGRFGAAERPLSFTAGSRSEAPKTMDTPRYRGNLKGRWISDVAADGRTVELDDGSVWEVSGLYHRTARGLEPATNVSIHYLGSSAYPYQLSTAGGRSISARLSRDASPRRRGAPEAGEEMTVEP